MRCLPRQSEPLEDLCTIKASSYKSRERPLKKNELKVDGFFFSQLDDSMQVSKASFSTFTCPRQFPIEVSPGINGVKKGVVSIA